MKLELEFLPNYSINDNKVVPKKPGIAGLFDAEGQLFFITYSLSDLQQQIKLCPYKQEATHFSFLIFQQTYTYRDFRPYLKEWIEKYQPRRNKRFNPQYRATTPTIKTLIAANDQLREEVEGLKRDLEEVTNELKVENQKYKEETKALHRQLAELWALLSSTFMPTPLRKQKQKSSASKAQAESSSYRLLSSGGSLVQPGSEGQPSNITSLESVRLAKTEKMLPMVIKTLPVIAESEVEEQLEVEMEGPLELLLKKVWNILVLGKKHLS